MYNVKLATSLHILTLLCSADGGWLTSDFIASSVNVHPAIIRKEISNLREHGLVISKEGKGGGSALAKPAKDIKLSDIYKAVMQQQSLLGRVNNPNPTCPIGKNINKHLDDIYVEAENTLIRKLSKTNLLNFAKQFN